MSADIPAIILAGVSLLGAIGASVKFLWNKIEARFVAIDSKLAKCQEREDEGNARAAAHVTVIELLWLELQRLAPDGSAAIVRAAKLLSDIKKEAAP